MNALMVVVRVELVDQGLQRADGPGWRACVQPFLQGLMEPLVLALRRRLSRLPGDGLDTKVDEVVDELAGESAAGGLNAKPLSESSRCGTPQRRVAVETTCMAALDVSPSATRVATAMRV